MRILIITALCVFAIPFSTIANAQQAPVCSAADQSKIDDAVKIAKLGLGNAVKSLDNPDSATIDRFSLWFGAPASDRVAKVKDVYSKALSFFNLQTYRCSIMSTSSTHPGQLASVDPGDPFAMTFELAFFDLKPGVADSPAGVIIHELTHQPAVGNTDDGASYGTSAAKKRAKDDPNRASRIADNYQYFVESELYGI